MTENRNHGRYEYIFIFHNYIFTNIRVHRKREDKCFERVFINDYSCGGDLFINFKIITFKTKSLCK